jgi:hypothetical protein
MGHLESESNQSAYPFGESSDQFLIPEKLVD